MGKPPFFGRGMLYDFMSGQLTYLGRNISMDGDSFSHAAASLADGKVLSVRGVFGDGTIPNYAAALFDPMTNSFVPTADTRSSREGPAAAALPDGKVLIAVGWRQYTAAMFDPETSNFRLEAPLHFARIGHTATLLMNGEVLVTGAASVPFRILERVIRQESTLSNLDKT